MENDKITDEKLKEINDRYKSYNRTEKALEDEQAAHVQKSKSFHYEFMDFIRNTVRDGYKLTNNGWVKDDGE